MVVLSTNILKVGADVKEACKLLVQYCALHKTGISLMFNDFELTCFPGEDSLDVYSKWQEHENKVAEQRLRRSPYCPTCGEPSKTIGL